MLGTTHITVTASIVTTPLLFGIHLDSEYTLFIIASIVGAIFPDIDEPNSIIGKRMAFLSYPIKILFGHRTITHNFIVAIIIAIFGALSNIPLLVAFSIGMFLHIVEDSLTLEGVKGAWFPVSKFNYNFVLLPRMFRFKVGGAVEYIILLTSLSYLFFILTRIFN